MNYCEANKIKEENDLEFIEGLSAREITVLKLYIIRHNSNRHKMMMPTICDLSSVK